MPFSVVSDSFKQQLEQERSRLLTERDAIIEAAIAQATAEIDQTIANLNSFLGGEAVALEDVTPSNGRKKTGRGPGRKPKAVVEEPEAAPARASKVKAAVPVRGTRAKPPVERSKARAASPAVDLPLKRQFKNLTQTQATYKVLADAPDHIFSTDEVIAALYLSLNEDQQAAARKSIGLVLGRGSYQGKIEKVQEDPKLFKHKPDDSDD
jgi:hypothetical protein